MLECTSEEGLRGAGGNVLDIDAGCFAGDIHAEFAGIACHVGDAALVSVDCGLLVVLDIGIIDVEEIGIGAVVEAGVQDVVGSAGGVAGGVLEKGFCLGGGGWLGDGRGDSGGGGHDSRESGGARNARRADRAGGSECSCCCGGDG